MLWAVWIVIVVSLGAWSLLAWGAWALLTLDPARLGALEPLIEKIPYSEWLDRWWPAWQDALRLALQLGGTALRWIGDAAPIVVGVTWGVGVLALLAIALLLTLIVRIARKPAAAASAPGTA